MRIRITCGFSLFNSQIFLIYCIPLCYFVITFVSLRGKKNLTTKALKGLHKGFTKDMNYKS